MPLSVDLNYVVEWLAAQAVGWGGVISIIIFPALKLKLIMVAPMPLRVRVVCSSQDTNNLEGHHGPHPPAPPKTLA